MTSTQTFRVALLAGLSWAASQFFVTWGFGTTLAFLYAATGETIDPMLLGFLNNLVFMPAAVGCLAGYITVILLRSFPGLRALPAERIVKLSFFALFLGAVALFPASRLFPRLNYWTLSEVRSNQTVDFERVLLPAFGDGFIQWAFPGILIGYAIVSAIKQQGIQLDGKQTALIIAGWGMGFALGGGLWLAGLDGLSYWTLRMIAFPQIVKDILNTSPYAVHGFIGGLLGMWSTLHALNGRVAIPNPA